MIQGFLWSLNFIRTYLGENWIFSAWNLSLKSFVLLNTLDLVVVKVAMHRARRRFLDVVCGRFWNNHWRLQDICFHNFLWSLWFRRAWLDVETNEICRCDYPSTHAWHERWEEFVAYLFDIEADWVSFRTDTLLCVDGVVACRQGEALSNAIHPIYDLSCFGICEL